MATPNGVFYSMSSVQDYDVGDWSYRAQLCAFVAGGMTDDRFIDEVSAIVNRGCHSPPRSTGPVDGADECPHNLRTVLQVVGLLHRHRHRHRR